MDDTRRLKARRIFDLFDTSRDGGLNKKEMADLVISVNPRVKFSSQQIDSIIEEVFRCYADFIPGPEGLNFEGLLRTYADGAGDIDRDFDAIKLKLDENDDGDKDKDTDVKVESYAEHTVVSVSSIIDESAPALFSRRTEHMPTWALSNITYDSTWLLVEDLVIIVKRLEAKLAKSIRSQGFSETFSSSDMPWSAEFNLNSGREFTSPLWGSLGHDYAIFRRDLSDISQKADQSSSSDERFDAHLAIGWTLYDHCLLNEALSALEKACGIKPDDIRSHFHIGNVLYSLGDYSKAKEHYELALNIGDFEDKENAHIRPLLHVNMGIVLESEGLLLNACEEYKKALSFTPKHYRALKLLGSALYGVGEYRFAEKALSEAIDVNPNFADAHCDLASTLHAIGEDNERAINEFQKALDLKPDHVEALYNLAGLFKDMGRYQRAGEMYTKVLVLHPNNWRAQLNKGVVLLGAGEVDESKKAFKEAFKMTNRVELYDAIEHLKLSKRVRKRYGKTLSSGEMKTPAGSNRGPSEGVEDVIMVDSSHFRRANEQTTPCKRLTSALVIRQFQLQTRLYRCDVLQVRNEFSLTKWLPISPHQPLKSGSKPEIEKMLRKLLHFLAPPAFQGAVKVINEKILCLLDPMGSGQVDLGMFFALISPICAGSPDARKRVVFDALVWRTSNTKDGLKRVDMLSYMRLLHAIYLPKTGMSEAQEVHGQGDQSNVSFREFVNVFDDHDWGFGLLDILAKLETRDRVRHNGRACAVCAYPITGPWFREITKKFNLCSLCYSEGKVPVSAKKEEYCFKEYNSKFEAVKDKLWLSRSKSLNLV